jgi:hypothetical protein
MNSNAQKKCNQVATMKQHLAQINQKDKQAKTGCERKQEMQPLKAR